MLSASACADTSHTTASVPAFFMSESRENRETGSGVVRTGATERSAYLAPSVPITPAFTPAATRMERIMCDTVVFPFVPVTPITFIVRSGCP